MRVVILVAALALLFAIAGWITLSRKDGQTSINLETVEIREDTGQIMNKGSQVLKSAGEEMQEQGEEMRAPQPAGPVTP